MKKILLLSALVLQPLCQAMDNQTTDTTNTSAVQITTAPQNAWQRAKRAWDAIPKETKKAGGAVFAGVACSAALFGGLVYAIDQLHKQPIRKNYKNFLVSYTQLTSLHEELQKKMLYYQENIGEQKTGEQLTKDHPYVAAFLDVIHTLYTKLSEKSVEMSPKDMLDEVTLTLKGYELAIGKISSWNIKNQYHYLADLIARPDVDPEVLVKLQEDEAKNKLRDLQQFVRTAEYLMRTLIYTEQK